MSRRPRRGPAMRRRKRTRSVSCFVSDRAASAPSPVLYTWPQAPGEGPQDIHPDALIVTCDSCDAYFQQTLGGIVLLPREPVPYQFGAPCGHLALLPGKALREARRAYWEHGLRSATFEAEFTGGVRIAATVTTARYWIEDDPADRPPDAQAA